MVSAMTHTVSALRPSTTGQNDKGAPALRINP